ncbi:MAG: hypothetical protein HY648_13410, partial [Acidobacteria bacterium]|nr:hypothetical protein [Acidobacteriota bacterium]
MKALLPHQDCGLGRESPEDKARKKIRQTYGVEIRDKGVLRQIAEMAKQGLGGNRDMAIRSAPVRDLIELYAMTAGQSTSGLPAKLSPVSLVQKGGSLLQQPGFSQGGLPSIGLDRIGAGVAQNAGPNCGQYHRARSQGVLREGDGAGGSGESPSGTG